MMIILGVICVIVLIVIIGKKHTNIFYNRYNSYFNGVIPL